MEVGIPYKIVHGSDVAVFNDSTDPNFVGYLDPESGITGLLDSASVRTNVQDKNEQDGAVVGDQFFGGKTGTIQGVIMPTDSATMNLFESRIKRASRGMHEGDPAYLIWTPSGSIERMIPFWRQGEFRVTGRRPKAFVLPCFSPKAFQVSTQVNSLVITPGVVAGEIGIQDPITDPITSAFNVTAQQYAVNVGDAPSWPSFRLDGPMVNPTILNLTTGQEINLVVSLGSADYLTLDSETGIILLNGSQSAYTAYDNSTSEWWQVLPTSNDVRLQVASSSSPAKLTMFWQHAWE